MKHIIFDLDETIGTFYECSLLYEALGHTLKKKVKNIDFFKVIDTFPEFFRPGIFDIFNYIKDIKDIEINLYTNNPYKLWVYMIKSYIENKIGKKIFKHVIYGWKKFDGTNADTRRTTHAKTLTEYNRIIDNKKRLKMLFLDDVIHPRMIGVNMTYLHLKPYKIGKPINHFITKYLKSSVNEIEQKNKVEFISYILNRYQPEEEPTEANSFMKGTLESKEILPNVKIFLNDSASS